MRHRPRALHVPFRALPGVPTESPLPRFTVPTDRAPAFDAVAADPGRYALELRPAGERVLVHCFASARRELTVALLPSELGLTRVRPSLPPSIIELIGRLADASGAVGPGMILDAVLVDRPGFRAVGPVGAPLADVLVVSDLPYLDGELLIGRPWDERRALLEELITASNAPSLLDVTETRQLVAESEVTTVTGMLAIVRDRQSLYRAQPGR